MKNKYYLFSIRYFFVLVLCCFALLVVKGQSPRSTTALNWHQLQSEVDGISAKFPKTPISTALKDSTGSVPITKYSLSVNNSYLYEIAVYNMLGQSQEAINEAAALIEPEYVASTNGKILSSNNIQHLGCQGKEYISLASPPATAGKAPPSMTIHTRVFVSGQKIYWLLYTSLSETKQSIEFLKYFFDSFEITDKCTGGLMPIEPPSTEIKTEFVDGITDSATGWKKVVSNQYGVEFSMPNRTKVETRTLQSQPFPVFSTNYTSNNQTAVYLVQATGDVPGDYSSPNSYQIALDLIQKNLANDLAASSAKITFIRNLKVGAYPGREYSIRSDQRIGRGQIFVTPSRIYTFIASDEVKSYLPSNAERFFGSIRISVK